MARGTERRQLYYRKATVHKSSGTFQTLLTRALRALDDPTKRQEATDTAGSSFRLINQQITSQGMLCGNMLAYSQGAAQLLMATAATKDSEAEASSFRLEAIRPPVRDGHKTEFLEAMMFFCIKGDHALFLQSRALKAETFEVHAQWLLEHSKVLTDKQAVMLADQPSTNAVEAIKRYGVKSVEIGMQLATDLGEEEAPVSTRVGSKSASRSFEVTPAIKQFLTRMLGDRLDGVRLEDALDGRIDATVELKWAYSINDKAQRTLDRLAVALRNVAKEQVQINLNNGSTVEGKELRLVRNINVSTRDRVVEQTLLFRDMREQMADLIDSKAV